MDQNLLKILGGDTKQYPHALERNYPRIFATLMLLWGTPEIDPYFVKLMVNDRTDREGFPPDVASEIVYLSLVHAGQYHKDSKDDVWSPEARMFTNFNPLGAGKSPISWPSIPRDAALAIQSLDVPCNQVGLFRAATAGNVAAIRMFLEAGVHLETRNDDGWTILMATIHKGHEELASLLIQKGAQVNVSENGGNTPLHLAAFDGRLSCCRLLVSHQAEIDARSNFGWTPLYQSVARHHMNVATYLIAHGAKINASGRDGLTPLHKAAATGSLALIELLMSHGADTALTNQLGETSLALALKNHQEDAVSLLRGGSY